MENVHSLTSHDGQRTEGATVNAMVVRVVVVDDHKMVLDGLVAAIGSDPTLEIVGTGATVAEGLHVVGETCPDVVVSDFQLPDGLGSDLAGLVAADGPRVLIITGHDPRPVVATALASGCAGFMSKGGGIDELLNAVKAVALGAAVFPAELLRQTIEGPLTDVGATLTERETGVLNCLAEAKSAATIAEELYLSEHTVRNHIRSVLTKLNARSQLEAVVIAAQAGLVAVGRR